MIRKTILLGLLTMLALFAVACGGSAPEVDVSQYTDQIADLQNQLTAAQDEASSAKADLDAAMVEKAEGGEMMEGSMEGSTLKAVQDRGTLNCGGNAGLVGFGFLNPDTNEITGFDVDFCKAVAAAVYGAGGAENIEVIPTTGSTRFPVLQSGEADILIRNTTWTLSRDTDLGFEFGPVTFYDGQGMMVSTASGIESLEDLDGGSVCVQAGTTTEKNLADVVGALGIDVESQVYEDNAATVSAFQNGLCDGFTTDKSGLVATQSTFDTPSDFVILDETMSKEPLGPLVRHGDNQWGDIMRWVVNCTIQAEESGISQANVDDMLKSEDPTTVNMLGQGEVDYGAMIGLNKDFCYQVISQVGSYADIYNRHLGPDTAIGLARGINAQYTDGGLIYAPPFR